MKLKISVEAEKFIQKSKNPLKNRLIENILIIKKDPYHNKYKYIKTKRSFKRSRCGDYRIIFYVDKKEDTLIIVDINHRKRIYK
jgi:mRNA-degrading endonuclease RelE of RelBE toxin-antitoxin system